MIRNGTLTLKNGRMDYIRFGKGARVLLMLPGLGDGLRTVKGTALPMALLYRRFAKKYTVYAFSRREPLAAGMTTRDMAAEQAQAMEALGIDRADILGVSMGGMIAQWLAIDHPHRVGKLILTVTCAEQNPVLRESIREWVDLAKAGDHAGFMDSNLRRIYSERYYRQNKWMTPLIGALTKPKSYDRFFIQAEACLTHDARAELGKIQAQTLVIGGEKDLALGGEASKVLAAHIPGAALKMYPQWGHGLYEEAGDFNDVVLAFLDA